MYLPLLKCQININVTTTASNALLHANQIDMTGTNSVVSFAQTLVCSLCYYYLFNELD